MPDISKIKLPSGTEYDIKDATVPHSRLSPAKNGTDLSLVRTGDLYKSNEAYQFTSKHDYNSSVLLAGETTITITSSNTNLFTVDEDTGFDIYTDMFGLSPTNAEIFRYSEDTSYMLRLTFPAQSVDVNVMVRFFNYL